MKRELFIVLILLGVLIPLSVCAKEEGEKPTKEILSKKEISSSMADVWCKKLAECDKNSDMGPKECRKVLSRSFKKGFDKVAEGQKVQVTKSTLGQCSESIKKDSCDALKEAHSLPGCEFIALLNRS